MISSDIDTDTEVDLDKMGTKKLDNEDDDDFHDFYQWTFLQIQDHTVKPVFSGHSKTDKTKVLKANDSLMKVQSIAECSLGAFCNTFDLH